jgi:3-oxoacyl-(acyl-carrier-protein) synthase
MEFDEDGDENNEKNEEESKARGRAKSQQKSDSSSNLWEHMSKQLNEKAKCEICGVVLSRQNGSTTGLRKHLFRIDKMAEFAVTSTKRASKSSQLSVDEKKKLHALIINCIIEDGRGFNDTRRPGLMKVLNHLAPGKEKRNTRLISICSSLKGILLLTATPSNVA